MRFLQLWLAAVKSQEGGRGVSGRKIKHRRRLVFAYFQSLYSPALRPGHGPRKSFGPGACHSWSPWTSTSCCLASNGMDFNRRGTERGKGEHGQFQVLLLRTSQLKPEIDSTHLQSCLGTRKLDVPRLRKRRCRWRVVGRLGRLEHQRWRQP